MTKKRWDFRAAQGFEMLGWLYGATNLFCDDKDRRMDVFGGFLGAGDNG